MQTARPWHTLFDVVESSATRYVLRRQARRYLAMRVPTAAGFVVRVFAARYDGSSTQIENFKPIVEHSGGFDEAFAELAEKLLL